MITVEQYYYVVFCVMAAVFGLVVGSFLNVVIYRLPIGESLSKNSSHCPHCNSKIRFYDNIPLISFIILGGKCRNCKKPISPRYFVVELLNCLLWLGMALLSAKVGYVYSICACIVISCLICAAFIDFEHLYIPDRLWVIIALAGAVACFTDSYIPWPFRLYGLLFCAVFFGGAYLISFLILKKEGLGFGDVKLMCALGLFLGLKAVFFTTLLACTVASVVLVAITIKRSKNEAKQDVAKNEGNAPISALNDSSEQNAAGENAALNAENACSENDGEGGENPKEYPFVPFLATAAIIACFVGELLVNAYLNLF